MIRAANISSEFAAAEIKTSLVGKKCWHAHSTQYSTVGLALGRKIPRDKPLKQASGQPEEYRKFGGELHLIVWCSWRLARGGVPLVSSDAEGKVCDEQLRVLIGRTVEAVEISFEWELRITFSGGAVLTAFPDHVGPDANYDRNWELWRPDSAYQIGADLACEVLDRENRRLALQSPKSRWAVAEEPKVKPRRTNRAIKSPSGA